MKNDVSKVFSLSCYLKEEICEKERQGEKQKQQQQKPSLLGSTVL